IGEYRSGKVFRTGYVCGHVRRRGNLLTRYILRSRIVDGTHLRRRFFALVFRGRAEAPAPTGFPPAAGVLPLLSAGVPPGLAVPLPPAGASSAFPSVVALPPAGAFPDLAGDLGRLGAAFVPPAAGFGFAAGFGAGFGLTGGFLVGLSLAAVLSRSAGLFLSSLVSFAGGFGVGF